MKNVGDGRRVARVEKEVQHLIAQYLISGIRVRLPGLVTIMKVIMPADLRAAKVYVSVLGSAKQQEEALELLQEQAPEVQRYIGDTMRSRYCPKLTFYRDDTTEHVLKIEGILRDLEQERLNENKSNHENKSIGANKLGDGDSDNTPNSEEE